MAKTLDQERIEFLSDPDRFSAEVARRAELIADQDFNSDNITRSDWIITIIFGVLLPLIVLVWAWTSEHLTYI